MNYSQGKGRLYPAYSLSGSEGEENSPSLRARAPAYPQNNHQTTQSHLNHYNASQHKQRAYQQQQQHPLYHIPSSGAGLSDTPTSGNASDETLTDSDLITVARDSALLVHNEGKKPLLSVALKGRTRAIEFRLRHSKLTSIYPLGIFVTIGAVSTSYTVEALVNNPFDPVTDTFDVVSNNFFISKK